MKLVGKIKAGFYVAVLLLCGSSCQDWLSVSPKAEIKEDDLFKSENGFKDLLTGIYTGMCAKEAYGANVSLGMDVLGQLFYMGYYQQWGDYYALSEFDYENQKSETVIDATWAKMYNLVVNLNIFIEGLNAHREVFNEYNADVYLGEALGLRAFIHLDLLRMFGKSHGAGGGEPAIPYVATLSKEVTSLSTTDQVLGFVIRDLEQAAGLMENDPVRTGETGNLFLGNRQFHFNYYAVKAALARAYLYAGDKKNALKCAEEVIQSGKYPWVDRNLVTVAVANRDRIFSSEVIFMLNNTKLDDITNAYLRPLMIENQNNVLITRESILSNVYETAVFGSQDWRYIYLIEQVTSDRYLGRLWQYPNMPAILKNRQPLLRCSEMYLIAAECETDHEQAVEYFNTLRQHRGFAAGNDLPETVTAAQLTEEIAKEYRKEFAGEGQWFFYCKRTDRGSLPDVSVAFDKKYYQFPLPDIEIEYGNR